MTASRFAFTKVLVANRGEIACRIIDTLHRVGLGSVAICHPLDHRARHAAMAGTTHVLAGETPVAAHLDIDQIIAAARRTGADAVHPGYGFLSENAVFAGAVRNAGLVFIGPDPETIRLMGDKIESRNFASAHGVPVAPSALPTGDLEAFAQAAADIGFPLLIKAAAGGGGKGMSIVRDRTEMVGLARLAQSEAQRYFGDGRIYAERYVERPRHIEVQVFGDGEGGAIHLFERECSVQRRFQKIIEEAPSAGLPADLRRRICDAAVMLARAARYRNAGTVEFVLAPNGQFFFLEMNTRLQVEHPVTEMITGLDLVALQLAVASGAGLPPQDTIEQRGHAIECRICAEDPEQDFRPATGRIGLLRAPLGEGVRFDSGVREGQVISAAFDSMIAKLVVAAPTRAAAIERMRAALDQLAVLGVTTNSDYLGAVLRHPAFFAARLHTGFLREHAAELQPAPAEPDMTAAVLSAAALTDPALRRMAFETPEPYASIGQWRN
jgi:propionyl-CoA carboxylase alpha chain/3-methylcrotonyl-CoA carboxylase alpha subunit/acetyl-CoA/propionyl-CoA carboxylase biotin carboxyl carrier protein